MGALEMKIECVKEDEGVIIVLKEIFCNTVLETSEGNRLAVCMRDDTVELAVVGSDQWYRVNMQTGEIRALYNKSLQQDAGARLNTRT